MLLKNSAMTPGLPSSDSGSFSRGDGFVPIVAADRGGADRRAPFEQGAVRARLVQQVGSEVEAQASVSAYRDRRDRGTDFTDNRQRGTDVSLRLVGKGKTRWSALAYFQDRRFDSQFASVNAGRSAANLTLDQRVPARGYGARDGDSTSPDWKGNWGGKTYTEPLSHGRVYSEKEIWDNYTYFIRKVAPVAEEAGVRIGIHPDDPPKPMLAGVPRCIFSNFEGYKKAIEIANSPNIGVCFCVGSWLEGGKMTGKDPVEAIKYFAGKKKLFKIHFRNVSAPLPHFTETLIDDGYYDMSKIMQALVDVEFDGIVIPDHIPALGAMPGEQGGSGGGAGAPYRPSPGLAYLIGCMHSMLKSAQNHKRRA